MKFQLEKWKGKQYEQNETDRIYIVGKTMFGKSYWMKEYIKKYIINSFDRIFYICPSKHSPGTLKDLNFGSTKFKLFISEDKNEIAGMLAYYCKLKDENEKLGNEKWIFIFDDFIKREITNKAPFVQLYTRQRHINISVVFITQKVTALPPEVRNSSSKIVMFFSGGEPATKQKIYNIMANDIRFSKYNIKQTMEICRKIFASVLCSKYKALIYDERTSMIYATDAASL